jgi:predicted restriction endonuclease
MVHPVRPHDEQIGRAQAVDAYVSKGVDKTAAAQRVATEIGVNEKTIWYALRYRDRFQSLPEDLRRVVAELVNTKKMNVKDVHDKIHGLSEFEQRSFVSAKIATNGNYGHQLLQLAEVEQSKGYFELSSLSDERERKLREIVRRRGQEEFRRGLIKAYGCRCVITGCNAEPALEAAHIMPYLGPSWNALANGLLLRADIHTLFDLDLIGIDPESRTVEVSVELRLTSYIELQGRKVIPPSDLSVQPNAEALRCRWESFSRE